MAGIDAVIVGSGPNGLTAAVTLAQAGLAVQVCEAMDTVGGGARTEELTLPGFWHDPCSAVHPLGVGSPVFSRLPLERHGLCWLYPQLSLAHPFPDGSAAVLSRSVSETADSLGQDADAYRRLLAPFAGRWDELSNGLLRPPLAGLPPHPLLLARFLAESGPAMALLAQRFRGPRARAILAGMAAHGMTPLTSPATGSLALMFATAAHEVGWPSPRGGSQAISNALAGYLTELGGEIVTGCRINSWADLPTARVVVFDTSPDTMAKVAGHRLGSRYLWELRQYRYGPGVFKIDYALAGPMPWAAADARRAGTVHLGPHYEDIATALHASSHGAAPDPPFLIVAQPSVTDPSRAPAGQHVLWVYAHVPNGWPKDATPAVEAQLERFAPGFTDLVLARHVADPAAVEAENANYVGGDIACGSFAGRQSVARPVLRAVPYATPDRSVYLCSAATPPGPGVHGMCGYHAARAVLKRSFGIRAY